MTTSKSVKNMIGDRNSAEFVQKGDAYITTPEAVYPLLSLPEFGDSGICWECACGNGAISSVLKRAGKEVVSTDLYDWGYGTSGVDYLTTGVPEGVSTVITNPPYSQFNRFLRKAYDDFDQNRIKYVWFLAPIRYLSSVGRLEFFQTPTYFNSLYVFSRRLPRMHALDYNGKQSSSMIDFGWFMFSDVKVTNPYITFIDWRNFEEA